MTLELSVLDFDRDWCDSLGHENRAAAPDLAD